MKESDFNGKTLVFKLAKIIARLLLAVDIVFTGMVIYSMRGNFSMSGNISVGNSARIAAVVCIAVILIVAQRIFTKKEKIYIEEKKRFERKLKHEKEREKERIKRKSTPPAIDLDKALEKVHPDLKNFVITNRNINKYIPDSGNLQSYIGTEPSLIDEYLPANLDIDPVKEFVSKLPAGLSGLSYSLITPNQRGMYFKFLEEPYNKNFETGYVMIFFFGLERQLIYGDNGGLAADVIGELRRVHTEKTFLNLSFNALVYFCKKNNTFIDFLKANYYRLNFDFTIYYLINTEKIFPSEAMIRFKKHFDFPEDALEVNPILFKEEIDRLLGSEGLYKDKHKKPVYSLEKYIRSIPRLENLPFPANRSMEKLVSEYIHPKHFYDTEPFRSEISDLLTRAYMNVIKNHFNVPAVKDI